MTRSTEPSRTSDITSTVTRTILGHLEEGRRPWSPCWSHYPISLHLIQTGAIDGFPESFRTLGREVRFVNPDQRDRAAESFVQATGAHILTGGQRPAYDRRTDQILMPSFEDFRSSEDYYSVLFHELVHWTGHESRLDRLGNVSRKSKEHAMEELVAELGAAFLCASLGLSCEPREDHAAHMGSSLDFLGQDTRFVFSAASCASRAVDYLKARVSP